MGVMPYSFDVLRDDAAEHFNRVAPRTCLDVGAGAGVWQSVYPAAAWTAVEIHEPYVERFGLLDRYSRVIVGDARHVDLGGPYDVAVLGDVLEHVPDPVGLYQRVRKVARRVIVQVPIGEWPQGESEGNPHEAHVSTIEVAELREWEGVREVIESQHRIALAICDGLAPLRVAVYTIALNEAAHIARWAESCADADYRVVVDTGSTDDTVETALGVGCSVAVIHVAPWRFDDARNASLALVPVDVDYCIALDADEVLVDGWRKHLEAIDRRATRPRYVYTWSWNDDGTPGLQYRGDKIHARRGYRWRHPVHEVITPTGVEMTDECGLEIHHHADPGKGRSYLPLLELSVRENPTDDRNAHYLAREYYFVGWHAKAAAEFKRHLAMPNAVWAPERAKSMRLLARCEPEHEEAWLLRAVAEDGGRRDPWFDLAAFYYRAERWHESLAASVRCLSITSRGLDYLSEAEPWGAQPWDYAAIAAHKIGLHQRAVEYGQEALKLAPFDARLARNLSEYEQSAAAWRTNPLR